MGLGKILIRADASAEIGTGHVMRCLALAQAWQDGGGEATFVMARCTTSVRSRLINENCRVLSIDADPGSFCDASCTNRFIESHTPDWVVLDGYRFDAEYESALRNTGYHLICVDDSGHLEHPRADLVLNQNVTARENFRSRVRAEQKMLSGTQFCLLRREFLRWRAWRREIPLVGSRILVSLGGSTPVAMGEKVMEAVDRIELPGLHAVFVIGGSTPDPAAMERVAAMSRGKISIRKDVSNMAMLMSESDVAVSAAGSTCWELCLLGLPSVLIDVAENQIPVAVELQRRQCALYAGSAEEVSTEHLANTIAALLKSQDERRLLSQRCRELVDGHGAERVIALMRLVQEERALAASTGAHT